MIMRTPRSMIYPYKTLFYFFFNDTATTEIYTLSLHDALPICIRLFLGKKWTEVDLDYLYEEYVQFLMLNDDGFIYYLPSFLLYFYDLKHFALEYYIYFMDKLELGLNESKATYNVGRRRQDYSGFNKLSHEQSKLVALFLVNTANLLPDGYMEKAQAQRALTNYWGNFLLF